MRGDYIIITEWMINKLRLRGDDLLLFAIIYGLTQGIQPWKFNYKYISDWLGLTDKTITNILKNLIEKGYLELNEDNYVNVTAKIN